MRIKDTRFKEPRFLVREASGMVCVGLPPPDQVWSHGTNSFAQFSEAIQDESITAIEADIVMGRDTSAQYCDSILPIMAHPPSVESDLSAATFLDEATKTEKAERRLTKHLKLDFKEFDAVEPTLEVFKSLKVENNGKIVYLNADIIEGPGKSSVDITVPADAFIYKCLDLIASDVRDLCKILGVMTIRHPHLRSSSAPTTSTGTG